MKTRVQTEADIEKLKYIAMGVSTLGSVAGLLYAIKTKQSGWGKVGWFFLGGMITGVPAGLVVNPMIAQKKADLQTYDIVTSDEFTGDVEFR